MIPIKPKNVFWSDEQWQAIHESGKSILVNAGAGSGKTAVLTTRIIEILKKGIGLDKLIVLTFTKAAASEMKERVRRELEKSVDDMPSLREELDYIDQSAIQTFDAFALSIVKRYHYLLGVDKSINIGDAVILSIKRKEIINQVFEELYSLGDVEFLNFVDRFTIKNDNQLQNYIFNVSNKLDLLSSSDEYLETYIDNYYNDEYINSRIEEYEKLIKFDLDRIKVRLKNIENVVSDPALVELNEKLIDSLTDLLASRTYKGFKDNVDISIPRMPRGSDEVEKIIVSKEKDEISKLTKRIKENLIYEDTSQIYNEIMSTKEDGKVIIRILREVEKRYSQFKKEINLYDFLDVAKLAIKLFRENDEVRKYYKENIHEILIDEYQDTSDIQEILISLISNNNVYMVGDIKQSIYRFRNANPNIFKDKYDLFKASDRDVAIDLSKNFRSRKEVLENINSIFSKVMTLDLGGVDYNENHFLTFGNKKYELNRPNTNYNLEILKYAVDESDLNKSEKEAFIIARDILDKLRNNYQVFDKDAGVVRSAKFSDFTILTTEKSKYEIYKKIFEYLGLPLVIHKEEDFVRSNEIFVIKNLLRAVLSLNDYEYYQANFKDSVLSILRSFLVEAKDEDISLIFLGNIKDGLNLRFNDIYTNLILCSKLVEKSSLKEILHEIYRKFDVYYKIVKLGNVEETENKLNFLLKKFEELDKIGYKLKDAISYLEVLIEEGLDIEGSGSSKIDGNAINMMSIHKSKGLEFPICYFAELSSRFRLVELNDRILFDKGYGLIIPVFKEGLKDTIYKELLRQKYLVEEISERLRVFYVALTRAKEKIIIVMEDYEEAIDFKQEAVPMVERLNYNSLYSVLNSIKHILIPYSRDVLHNGTTNYEEKTYVDFKSKKTKPLIRRTVSAKLIEEETKTASTSSRSLQSREEIANMEFGTLIHEYFELLDYRKDIRSQLENTDLSENIKTKIEAFFNLDIFKKEILNIYHEYQFSYLIDNIIYRGIIDLVLETKTELLIIDYKLSNLDNEAYNKQLKIYYDYLITKTNKPVKAYLYSIINEELREVIGGN